MPDDPAQHAWAEAFMSAVKRTWVVPSSAVMGHPGLVLLRVHVRADGVIDDVLVVKATGCRAMTDAARDAVLGTSPLPPFPHDETDPDGDVSINYLFAYNVSEKAQCRFRDRWSP